MYKGRPKTKLYPSSRQEFFVPDACFTYKRLINDALIQKYANPKSVQKLKSL